MDNILVLSWGIFVIVGLILLTIIFLFITLSFIIDVIENIKCNRIIRTRLRKEDE